MGPFQSVDAQPAPRAAAPPALCCANLQNTCNSGAGCPYAHAPLRVGGPMCQFGEQCRHRHHLGVHLTPEQQREATEALAQALRDAATADGCAPSLACVVAGNASDDAPRLHQLLNLADEQVRDSMRDRVLAHLAQLDPASSPVAVMQAALRHGGARVVDGVCALALYSSDLPRGELKLYNAVNTALRIALDGNNREERFSRDDAEFVCDNVGSFVDAVSWMLREVLPKCRDVTFRGVSYQLHRPRVGIRYEQLCFNSMSDQHRAADRFARRTMIVLMTQSGASISFASMIPRESEVLLPPGVFLEVVARASATLLNVLHLRVQLLTMREVGMRPTANELFRAARAALPVYEDFRAVYQLPSVAPRGSVGGAVGGEAGGGAAAGDNNNNSNNQNAMRLDHALDQNIINSSSGDIFIIADGGTGKTAAAVFAQVHFMQQDESRRLLPIFLPLSRLKEDDVTRPRGLDVALATALGCDTETLLQTAREFSVVAILDSLDETTVTDAHWAGLLERNPAAQQCRVVMTSRPTPLATQQHQRIFGRARRVQVLDLLPLAPRNLNRIFAHLVDNDRNAQLPAALLASGDATPLLAGFAATLVNQRVDISGITGQRDLLELYLQHTCDLRQQALSQLCLHLLKSGFHCKLVDAKRAASNNRVAARVPCRVEDEFDDGADFSLLHRSLVEHVVAREVAAERLSFEFDSDLRRLSAELHSGVTRMLLADARCPFGVRVTVISYLIGAQNDLSLLELAQQMLVEEEERAGGQPTQELALLLDAIGIGFKSNGNGQLAEELCSRALRMFEALYEPLQDSALKRRLGQLLAISYNCLASTDQQQKNYDAAQQHYERSIVLSEQHGTDQVSIAQMRVNLGSLFIERGDSTRALRELKSCLAIYERHVGREHHYVAMCLGLMGNAHNNLKQPEQALLLLQEALAIQSRTLRADHLDTASTYWRLASTHSELGNMQEARQHWHEAARIFALNGRRRDAEFCREKLARLGG